MTKTKRAVRYIVLNPRNIPVGRYIIHSGEQRFYEGDEIDASQVKNAAALVDRGFLKEVE